LMSGNPPDVVFVALDKVVPPWASTEVRGGLTAVIVRRGGIILCNAFFLRLRHADRDAQNFCCTEFLLCRVSVARGSGCGRIAVGFPGQAGEGGNVCFRKGIERL